MGNRASKDMAIALTLFVLPDVARNDCNLIPLLIRAENYRFRHSMNNIISGEFLKSNPARK